jgi:hypothetical protein
MSLPVSLLQHVEQHGCFSGCYGSDANASACLSPTQPLQPMVIVSCLDCLGKIAVPQSLVPAGTTTYTLSQSLSDYMRLKRGFKLSRSGYHTAGTGFWLSFVYYDCGVFLISAERSRQLGADLDVLMLGIQHKVVQPPDSRMSDPKQYRTETVYVNFSQFQHGVSSKQQLLSSPQARMQPQAGWQKVTLAEFLPLSTAPPTPNAVTAAPPRPPKVGDTCPKCKARIAVRPLLNGSFVGCLC